MLYDIKKIGAYYCVIAKSTGLVQFRSTVRSRAADWKAENEPAQA